MSKTLDPPRYYRRSRWRSFWEGYVLYGGGVGQWSWLVHRITGLGVLVYLIAHIYDTFLVVVSPAHYDFMMGLYGGYWNGVPYAALRWGFRLGELALIACVLFHALNGLRIIAFDFWPWMSRSQRPIFWVVLIAFLVIMLVVGIIVVTPLLHPPLAVPH